MIISISLFIRPPLRRELTRDPHIPTFFNNNLRICVMCVGERRVCVIIRRTKSLCDERGDRKGSIFSLGKPMILHFLPLLIFTFSLSLFLPSY